MSKHYLQSAKDGSIIALDDTDFANLDADTRKDWNETDVVFLKNQRDGREIVITAGEFAKYTDSDKAEWDNIGTPEERAQTVFQTILSTNAEVFGEPERAVGDIVVPSDENYDLTSYALEAEELPVEPQPESGADGTGGAGASDGETSTRGVEGHEGTDTTIGTGDVGATPLVLTPPEGMEEPQQE